MTRTSSRWVVAATTALIAFALMYAVVQGAQSHPTSGTAGQHSGSSHSYNPGHLWVKIGADHTGNISSGGRHHHVYQGVPVGAFGGDFSMDVSQGASQPSRVYIDYAGYGAGTSYPPNNNLPISFSLYVANGGGTGACQWQQWTVRATYWDTAGTLWINLPIGILWIEHLENWTAGIGATISANASHPNPYGTGTVNYISGWQAGTVYPVGDGVCSTGAHTHLEFYSNHAWGGQYEWHGEGPDYYPDYSAGHVHYMGGSYTRDSVSQGTSLFFGGGGTTSYWMRDNPYYGDH